MKERKKNLELKIYKVMGVKKFRNILIKFIYLCVFPFFIIYKVPKEERKKLLHNTSSNYFMKKGNGLKDLKDFKKCIWFNSSIHIVSLAANILCLPQSGLYNIFWLILNTYCIMLQRYNYIRIRQVIKKHEKFEENKIYKIKTELKEKDNLLKEHTYTFGLVGKAKETKTIDQLLENASLERLKQIKIILEDISNKEKIYERYPSLIYSSTTFEEKNKNYCLKISRNNQ